MVAQKQLKDQLKYFCLRETGLLAWPGLIFGYRSRECIMATMKRGVVEKFKTATIAAFTFSIRSVHSTSALHRTPKRKSIDFKPQMHHLATS